MNTSTFQYINASKYFENTIHIRSSPVALFIKPGVGYVGESSILFFRYSDAVSLAMGDSWRVGQSIRPFATSPSYMDRAFSIIAQGVIGGRATEVNYLTITGDGNVLVHPTGSLSSPSIHTTSLNINGTNISVLYQSKADMTNYITSGTLTNYVNITSTQTLTGTKTCTGGFNTKPHCIWHYGFKR